MNSFFCFSQKNAFDIVIYGGTSAAISAAIQSSRMGKTVVLIEPTERIGGLTTGGLGQTKTESHEDAMWTFEPSAALKIFHEMLKQEKNITIVYNQRLNRKSGVKKSNGAISSISMESGKKFLGKVFIDATY